MVNQLRITEISKGKNHRNEFDVEKEAVKYARRSIVSSLKISKGTKISKEMLDIKRPATGIPPKFFDKIIGSVAIRDIEEDVPIKFEDISQ